MLNSAPCEWTVGSLARHCNSGATSAQVDGKYVPARPYGLFSMRSRLRLAWDVFVGKADALYWPGQTPKAY